MVIATLYLIGLASGVAALWADGIPFALPEAAPILFRYFMLLGVGLSLAIACFGHVFASDRAAKRIGWPTGNPFQKELGYWDGAAGLAAMLCFTHGPEFWLAVVIINAPFWAMAGLLHAVHIARYRNFNLDNALPAIANLAYAVTMVFLYLEAIGGY